MKPLIARSTLLGVLLVLAVASRTPDLKSRLDVNLENLAIGRFLIAQMHMQSFFQECFSSPAQPLITTEPEKIPAILASPETDLSGGRLILWRFLARPTEIDWAKVHLDQGEHDRWFFNLVEGCSAFRSGQSAEALSYFAQLPHIEEMLWKAGVKYEDEGALQMAEQLLSLAAQLGGTKPEIHYVYVDFLRRHGGSKAVVLRELETVVHLAPQNWIYRAALGEVLYEIGQYEKAVLDFSEAINLAPEVGSLYFERSLAYIQMANYSEACADLRRAFSLNPAQSTLYAQPLCKLCAVSVFCSDVTSP